MDLTRSGIAIALFTLLLGCATSSTSQPRESRNDAVAETSAVSRPTSTNSEVSEGCEKARAREQELVAMKEKVDSKKGGPAASPRT